MLVHCTVPRPRRTAATGLAALALTAAGCGLGGSATTAGATGAGAAAPGGGSASALPTLPATPSDAIATAAAAPTTAPTSAPTSAVPDADVPPEVVLQGDGLGLLAADATVVRLPFGAPGAAVRQALERSLGPTTAAAVPCPQGPRTAVDVDGFRAVLDGERFVGWTDRGAADRSTTTADGAGAGAHLVDVASALPGIQVVPGPAGAAGPASWTAPGGLHGTVDGDAPTSTVTELGAGESCPG